MPALSMRASVRPGSIDAEKRTAEVIWTTGARVMRGFWDPYWEELSLDPKCVRMNRLNNGAPLLAAHDGGDLGSVLGVVESARLEKGQGVATVRFAKAEDCPEADKVMRMAADGILQNISVGYRVHRLEKVSEEADKIPVMRATDWEPYELSVVPMGADDGAGFRCGDAKALNPCVIVTHEENRAMADPVTPTPPAPAADPTDRLVQEAREANARAAQADSAAAARAADEAVQLERTRISETYRMVRMTKLGDSFADSLIKAGTPLDKVREIVLEEKNRVDEGLPTRSHLGIEAGDDQREKFVRGAAAAIFMRAGTTASIEAAKKNPHFAHQFSDVATDPGEFRNLTLLDLARESLERRGQSTRGLHGERLVQRALEFRGDAGMNTTSDFAILLETAVNKTFLGAYAQTPVTWRRWCGQKSVKDFRTSTFYRPGSFGKLDKVTEGGEVKHKNVPDGAKATLTPGTVGNIIGVTRRAIVNDDMGVFNSLAAQLGQAAALSVELDAFALVTANSGLGATMTDTKPVFDAAHSNIGGSGAMSVTTWDSAQSVLAAQTDVSGNILDLTPKVLLCPKSLGFTAKKINAVADPTANINSAVVNPAAGMVDDIVATARLTGTRHYFLADPGLYPVFAVGFLDGQEAPRIESQQSFEYDGIQWRIIFDYGTSVLDFRGGITSPGA